MDPSSKIDDSKWHEVQHINGYVVFVVYLSLAVRGTGILAVTWTTVVLLGGFVATLRKEDFWCLTVVTFLQTAGIFNESMIGQIGNLAESIYGVMAASGVARPIPVAGQIGNLAESIDGVMAASGVARPIPAAGQIGNLAESIDGVMAASGDARPIPVAGARPVSFLLLLGWVQTVVVIVMCVFPFLFLVVLGLFASTGLSLWRLIKHHHYGGVAGDNMHPALYLLYSLAVVQGALFSYRLFLVLPKNWIVDRVATAYGFDGRASVSDYLSGTLRGCMKTQSFVKRRNLITYAVDLMESKSPDDCRSGTGILGTIIGPYNRRLTKKFPDQCVLIEQLIGSTSCSHILQKLLRVLDVRNPSAYDRETRQCAARIVALVAKEILLEQFPRGVQSISYLIETFEDPDLLAQQDNFQQLAHGLSIIYDLASDENNCRIISNTQGLLCKVMAPVTRHSLRCIGEVNAGHEPDRDCTWRDMVNLSLNAMSRLVAAPGETGAKVRIEISGNKEAVCSMERILNCEICKEDGGLHILVMQILAQLCMDTQSREVNFIEGIENIFIKVLVHTFTGENNDSSRRELAGEALAKLSLFSKNRVGFILNAGNNVVDRLKEMLLDVKNKAYRISAAEILEKLCAQYTPDDEYWNQLRIAMTAVIPKLLGQIYISGSSGGERHTGTEPQQSDQGRDIENQGGHQQDNNQGNTSSSSDLQNNGQGEDKIKEEELHAALFSLCVTVCDKMISNDQDLAHYADARKLKNVVEKMKHLRPTCLRILKLTSMMVISMMKHRSSYCKEDLDSLMVSLSTASKQMFLLDGSMFSINGKPLGSLVYLVKEAQELVDKYKPPESQASTSGSGNPN